MEADIPEGTRAEDISAELTWGAWGTAVVTLSALAHMLVEAMQASVMAAPGTEV